MACPLFSRPKLMIPALVLLLAVVVLAGCNFQGPGGFTGQTGGPRDVVTVFFSKYQGNQSIVEEVVRRLPAESRNEPVKFAITELLKGPTQEEAQQGFYSEIPKGTHLLGVDTRGNTLTLNFSQQFSVGGGANSMAQRLEEVKQTVFSNDSRHQLEIAVEGEKLELLGGEGLEVDPTLQREAQ